MNLLIPDVTQVQSCLIPEINTQVHPTVRPRGLDPIYIVTFYKIWVETFWPYNIGIQIVTDSLFSKDSYINKLYILD